MPDLGNHPKLANCKVDKSLFGYKRQTLFCILFLRLFQCIMYVYNSLLIEHLLSEDQTVVNLSDFRA